MSNHFHVLSRIFNTPLCIDPVKMSFISAVGDAIMQGRAGPDIAGENNAPPTSELGHNQLPDHIGIVKVFGTLVGRNGGGDSGSTSYNSIESQCSQLVAEGKTAIIFEHSSGGGETSNLIPCMDFIRSLPVRTVSYTGGSALSASYGLFSACDVRYCAPSAMLGAIGVIADIVNYHEYNEKAGIKHTIIRSKEEKALGNPNESFSQDSLQIYVKLVMSADALFNEAVAKNGSIGIEGIENTKGTIYMGADAIELGLADKIVPTLSNVIELLSDDHRASSAFLTRGRKTMALTAEETQQLADAQIATATATTQLDALKASTEQLLITASQKATADAIERCSAIVKSGSTLKIESKQVLDKMKSSMAIKDINEVFTALAEAKGHIGDDLAADPAQSSLNGDSGRVVDLQGFGSVKTSNLLAETQAILGGK